MKIIRSLIVILGLLCIVSVLFILTVSDHWWMRAFDYPRLQITILTGVVLLVSVLVLKWTAWARVYFAVLALALIYQSYILSHYVLPVAQQVPTRAVADPARSFTLLSANVKMDNRDAQAFLALVARHDPDVVLVIEPNAWWIEQLQPLRDNYPYVVEHPQDTYYGMSLYSRLPLQNTEINYFEDNDTPSIQTVLHLPSGDEVLLYGEHPRPPLPENSVSAADKELIKIANRVKDAAMPVVVAGDFNDVPWSFTVNTFQMISGLRDVRVGRGLYNTYDAQSPILRLPIDHIFVSPGLSIANFARSEPFSSDHFALLATLVLDDAAR